MSSISYYTLYISMVLDGEDLSWWLQKVLVPNKALYIDILSPLWALLFDDSWYWRSIVFVGLDYVSYKAGGVVYTSYGMAVSWFSIIGLYCIHSFLCSAYHQYNCLEPVSIGLMEGYGTNYDHCFLSVS